MSAGPHPLCPRKWRSLPPTRSSPRQGISCPCPPRPPPTKGFCVIHSSTSQCVPLGFRHNSQLRKIRDIFRFSLLVRVYWLMATNGNVFFSHGFIVQHILCKPYRLLLKHPRAIHLMAYWALWLVKEISKKKLLLWCASRVAHFSSGFVPLLEFCCLWAGAGSAQHWHADISKRFFLWDRLLLTVTNK